LNEPIWIERPVVERIHQLQIDQFGGLPGLRDEGLDSSLARPKNLYAYQSPDLVDLAASYAFGITRNHPFVDGNKRTAFLTSALFLRRNLLKITATNAEIVAAMLYLAEKSLSEAGLANWLRERAKELVSSTAR